MVQVLVIDTVIYDFGNVLIRWNPRLAFLADDAEADRFFAEFDFAAFNHVMDSGVMPYGEARAQVAADSPQWLPFLDAYVERYPDSLAEGPVPGSQELVTELRAQGFRLFGLTNWWQETFHHALAAAPAIGLMDDVLVSGRVGLAKPNPAIFRLLIDRFDINPERTVFIDDSLANIEAASALGFHTVHFTDTPTLRASLRALNVAV